MLAGLAQSVTVAAGGAPTPSWAEWAAAAQSVATAVALLVAGVWTYWLFVRQRQRYPRAKIAQRLDHRELPDGRRILHVSVELSNIGATLISLDRADVLVQRVAPLKAELLKDRLKNHDPKDSAAPCEIAWHRIGYLKRLCSPSLEIEPGEVEVLRFEFVIGRKVETLKVSSHMTNVEKRRVGSWYTRRPLLVEIGWSTATYYDLRQRSAPAVYAGDGSSTVPRRRPQTGETFI